MKSQSAVRIRVGNRQVTLKREHAERLNEYLEITGRTLRGAIDKAMEDYIECSVGAHLEIVQERGAKA
ncbi:MAG TPA: hypothetical protein VFA74_09145 [Terriglobales bacterium]|nr:hypothetical protein [Terriglobales bacterium]